MLDSGHGFDPVVLSSVSDRRSIKRPGMIAIAIIPFDFHCPTSTMVRMGAFSGLVRFSFSYGDDVAFGLSACAQF